GPMPINCRTAPRGCELAEWLCRNQEPESTTLCVPGSCHRGRRYLLIVNSNSVCPSFTPAFGSAMLTVRTVPCIPENLPVPPVIVPTVLAVSFPGAVLCATRAERVKNLSPFSRTYVP